MTDRPARHLPTALAARSDAELLRLALRAHLHQPAIALWRATEFVMLRDVAFGAPVLDLGCGNGEVARTVLRSHPAPGRPGAGGQRGERGRRQRRISHGVARRRHPHAPGRALLCRGLQPERAGAHPRRPGRPARSGPAAATGRASDFYRSVARLSPAYSRRLLRSRGRGDGRPPGPSPLPVAGRVDRAAGRAGADRRAHFRATCRPPRSGPGSSSTR